MENKKEQLDLLNERYLELTELSNNKFLKAFVGFFLVLVIGCVPVIIIGNLLSFVILLMIGGGVFGYLFREYKTIRKDLTFIEKEYAKVSDQINDNKDTEKLLERINSLDVRQLEFLKEAIINYDVVFLALQLVEKGKTKLISDGEYNILDLDKFLCDKEVSAFVVTNEDVDMQNNLVSSEKSVFAKKRKK